MPDFACNLKQSIVVFGKPLDFEHVWSCDQSSLAIISPGVIRTPNSLAQFFAMLARYKSATAVPTEISKGADLTVVTLANKKMVVFNFANQKTRCVSLTDSPDAEPVPVEEFSGLLTVDFWAVDIFASQPNCTLGSPPVCIVHLAEPVKLESIF